MRLLLFGQKKEGKCSSEIICYNLLPQFYF